MRKPLSGKDLKNQFKPYGDFARLYYGARDPAHDFRHIERMIGRLSMLSDGLEGVRPHFLHFLTAFHGLWLFWHDDPKFRAKAISFLQGLGWGELEIEEAAICLERHVKDPQTVEEKVVHDANCIELLGAFGIAKAFTVGGSLGQTFAETAEIFENRYLNTVKFCTPAGKRMAEEGIAYAKAFLTRLKNEW
jgi:uncharacterized protein